MDDFAAVRAPRSAYVHIPFCHRRCFYCDFAVIPLGDKANGIDGPGSNSIKSYLRLLSKEIEMVPKGEPLATVYIGGGTPSLLSPDQVSCLLGNLRQHFGFQYGAEITLEIDPASFDKIQLEGYLQAGINRVSLGAQSFNNSILEKIGRRHRKCHILQATAWLNDFFQKGQLKSWSLDLIQGLPEATLNSWNDELMEALATSAPHLSIYDLSIEPGTVFAWRQSRGELSLPEHDLAAEISFSTSSMLAKEGFGRYEISNYALPGHTSRHNRVYWSGIGWWGFGQGATSAPWGERLSRPRTGDAYKSWLQDQAINGLDPSLDPVTAKSMGFDEKLLVGLRRREGVDLFKLAMDSGWTRKFFEAHFKSLELFWHEALKRGWLKRRGMRFQLSDPLGMDISNQVFVQMFLWWDSLPIDCDAQSSLGEL